MNHLHEIQAVLINLFKSQVPPLQVRKDNEHVFEVAGTKVAMQGKQQVDGYYFGSVVPKPNDIRLYYFPIYTHVDAYSWISDDLRLCLKGKSCFHIKSLSSDMGEEIEKMIERGIELYVKDDLI